MQKHATSVVADKVRASTKGRQNALILETANSGYDRESVAWHHHDYSRRVLEGDIANDSWFAYVCQLDAEDAPFTDESCWVKANPNVGISITPQYLREQVDEARGMPSKANIVKRLNFCIWTQQKDDAIDMTRWRACPSTPVPDTELSGMPCYAGLDLGQSDDFSVFVRLWVLDDGRMVVRPRFWLPEKALKTRPNRTYDQWREAGVMEVTEGSIVDYDAVEDAVPADCLAAGVRELAFDKRFASQMALHLEGKGITMVDQPQGFQLNEASQRLVALVAAGRLCHEGHPIVTWVAANLVFRHGRGGEVRPDKDSAQEEVDGMVALIMVLARAIVAPDDEDPYTADRGIQVIDFGW